MLASLSSFRKYKRLDFLDFNGDAIVDLWIFIISLTDRTRYFVMSIEMSDCKCTCIMDQSV